MQLMQSNYLYPELGDRENINNWIDQGSSNIEERASERVREIIDSYFPDHIDPEIEMRIRNEFPVRFQTGPIQTIEPCVEYFLDEFSRFQSTDLRCCRDPDRF